MGAALQRDTGGEGPEGDGHHTAAGRGARHLANISPTSSLALTTGTGNMDNETQTYSDLMHAGRMTHPSKSFKDDTKKFYEFFCTIHPKNDISREPGIITGFANLLFTNFPDYDYKVLYLVSKILTVIRLREVNNMVFKNRLLKRKAKKKGEDRPYSTRGRIQLGRLSAND